MNHKLHFCTCFKAGWLTLLRSPGRLLISFPVKGRKVCKICFSRNTRKKYQKIYDFFLLQNSSNVYFRTVFSARYNIYFYLLFIEKLIKPFLQYNLLFVQAVWPFLYNDLHTYENGQDFLDIQQVMYIYVCYNSLDFTRSC